MRSASAPAQPFCSWLAPALAPESGDLVEGLAGPREDRVFPGIGLPPANCGVDVKRIELEPIAAAAPTRSAAVDCGPGSR